MGKSILVELDDKFLESFTEFYISDDEKLQENFKTELEVVFRYKDNYFKAYRIVVPIIKEFSSSKFLSDEVLREKCIKLIKVLLEKLDTGIQSYEDKVTEDIENNKDVDLEFEDKNWTADFIYQEFNKIFSDTAGFNRVSKVIAQAIFEEFQFILLSMRIEKRIYKDPKDIIKENKRLKEKLSKARELVYEKSSEIREFLYDFSVSDFY